MLRYAHVTVDGRPIRYATEGEGPALLLIHGPPFDHRAWTPAIPYLAGHFRVVAPDLPGCGESSGSGYDSSPDAFIRSMAGLMTALRMVPSFVAGVSLGGGVALGLAARHPERVRALVGVGALGLRPWPGTFQARLTKLVRNLPGILALGLRLAPRAQARWFLRSAINDQQLVGAEIVEQVAATMRDPARRRALVRTIRQLDDWRFVMRQLGGVRAPTLLAWGEHDALYNLRAAEQLRHSIPGAQLVTLARAGHMLPIERPVELTELMRTFFAAPARFSAARLPSTGGSRAG